MTEFYDIIGNLKTVLQAQPFVNTVTTGGLEDVDLNKQTIFPLSHIIVNSAIPKSSTIVFNISIIAMDIVDESKSETDNVFVGNDNEQDVLNQQLQVLNQVYQQLRHGQLFSELIQVEVDPTCEPFTDRFENKLAGWTMTFDVEVPNEMTICGTAIPPHCADAFIQNSDGSFSANVASGSTLILEDVNITVIDQNDQELANVNIPSNVDQQIIVEVPPIEVNANVYNSIEDLIVEQLVTPTNPNIIIPDTEIVLKNSLGSIISTTNLPSSVSSSLTIPDENYDIYVNGTFQSSVSLPSQENNTININI